MNGLIHLNEEFGCKGFTYNCILMTKSNGILLTPIVSCKNGGFSWPVGNDLVFFAY